MIGLGRMGANMVRRLLRAGHECVVYDVNPAASRRSPADGAIGRRARSRTSSASSSTPRAVWLMVPAGGRRPTVDDARRLLEPGDIVIDGGNSYYHDDIDRAAAAAPRRGIHYVDVGTSGGVWGLERGYCLMIGGEAEVVAPRSDLRDARPGRRGGRRTPGREGEPPPAEHGYLHCGPTGAGHFVKMVHNGIEYGLMAAYAEG